MERVSRIVIRICVVWTLFAAGVAIAAPPASANPVYPTMNDTGGIYWRSAPDWSTPVAQQVTGSIRVHGSASPVIKEAQRCQGARTRCG